MAIEAVTGESKILEKLKTLLFGAINKSNIQIYLFGSWARESNRSSSDIDIAIWYPDSPGPEFFTNLRDLLEESSIPYRVDIVDLVHADPTLIEKVQKEGILWTD